MKNIYYILLIILTLLLAGCDNVNVIDSSLAYKEYIVVRAELKANQVFDGVTFTKTLPTDQQYDIAKAELKDVTAFIRINGVQLVPLDYTGNGLYKPHYNIGIVPGNTYELLANYNNSSIYAKTIIPEEPRVVSTQMVNNSVIYVAVKRRPGEAYASNWEIYSSTTNTVTYRPADFTTVISASSDTTSVAMTRTPDIPASYNNDYYKHYMYVKVYSFDPAYAEYFKTRNNNQPVSNSFAQGGDQVAWNVQGNNVIGLFIGVYEGAEVKAKTN